MTALDPAGLVVIAGRVMGIDPGAALAQMDVGAARAALAGSGPAAGSALAAAALADRDAAADAGIRLMHALLRHRPFPRHNEQVAAAAALQFLSLNGWRADLDSPAAAAVVVEALGSGHLSPGRAAAWLSPRLCPAPRSRVRLAPARLRRPVLRVPRLAPAGGRTVTGVMVTAALGGLALLAAACATGPAAPAARPPGRPPIIAPAPRPAPPRTTSTRADNWGRPAAGAAGRPAAHEQADRATWHAGHARW